MEIQREAGYPDFLEVICGPGDGIEFPITRTPMDIGSDPDCAVLLQFDQRVEPAHARLTVVSEGYRLRQLHGRPVYVNGRRAGKLRSRIARNGSTVKLGDTELRVQCAPDGLASRSRGVPLESDIGWALRLAVPLALSALAPIARRSGSLFGRVLRPILVLAVAVGLIAFVFPGFVPALRREFDFAFNWSWWRFHQVFYRLMNLF